MIIKKLIWFDDIIEKIYRKHNVQQDEIREMLSNKPHFRFVEKGHRRSENVYAAMGKTDNGRHLILFFVYKTDKSALILSARNMTKSEKKLYEKNIKVQ